MTAEWFVVVTRTALAGAPLPPYVVGPYPAEQDASDEANSDSGIAFELLTVDAKNLGYIADECYWTDQPPADGERIIPTA